MHGTITQFEPYPSTPTVVRDNTLEMRQILSLIAEFKDNFEILEDIVASQKR